MEINEVNSKGGCLLLAVKHLKQLQYNTMEALAWLERSEAFVPDESKTMQELRAAMIESLQREEALRGNLVKSEGSRDELKAALAKSIERETELERRLAASSARERRLTAYIGGLATEAEAFVETLSLPHHPSPHLDQEKFKHTGTFRVAEEDQARQGLAKPVEQPTGAKFPPWYNANSEFKA